MSPMAGFKTEWSGAVGLLGVTAGKNTNPASGAPRLKLKQFAEAFRLHAAHWDLCLLLVAYFQHIAGFEPRHHFFNVMNVDQVGAVRTPERVRVHRSVQFLKRAVVGSTFTVTRGDRN